jgi:hypothetical protein
LFLQEASMRGAFLISISVFVALVSVPRAWAQGNPLGPEFRVNTYTTGAQDLSSIASDALGNFVVVWQDGGGQDGSGLGIFGQRFDNGGAPLGPEFLVNTYTTAYQFGPSVAADASGNFVVVWQSFAQDGSSAGVFGQRYASSGASLGVEFRVNTYTTNGQAPTSIAADSSGNFVVVWQSDAQDGSSLGVFGQRFTSSGIPLGPEFRVNTYTTGSQQRASVASDTSGNFVVVWQSGHDGSSNGVFGQRYASSGAPLGPEFRVNTYTTGSQYFPDVSSDSVGNFVVVWVSPQDGSNNGVFGQRYASSGAPLGPEFRVNTYTTSGATQARPSIASDALGNFVVVWQTPQDPNYGIFGQRYASSGIPFGAEFRVNTYTTAGQTRAAVASDAAGHFVVVWSSDLQDGSNYGIFGQLYTEIVPVELMHFGVE